ncbi:hypothetical protein BGY98DRAFT_917609 [Russula aff. rugulosa BPL654]|nr:hypothetical protein BGY98DRAFT_917609 [Russula aff. rugulosa BPL654]
MFLVQSAAPGDIISFTFHPKNHTVTQSSFDAPCTPLYGGVDTGFVPVTLGTNDDDLPTREFIVEDTNPVWIHCQQGANTAASHCGKGMVFAVNPGPDGSWNSFAASRQKRWQWANSWRQRRRRPIVRSISQFYLRLAFDLDPPSPASTSSANGMIFSNVDVTLISDNSLFDDVIVMITDFFCLSLDCTY